MHPKIINDTIYNEITRNFTVFRRPIKNFNGVKVSKRACSRVCWKQHFLHIPKHSKI
ncbi:hypothetical protein C0J52_17845 [Blattella germanica]|nr:hypothetical protein C0J52_17845 [Blattella germanica]